MDNKNAPVNLLAYNITYNQYTQATQVPREELCNGFTVINIGDRIATVNGKILFPAATPATDQGDSVTIGGNMGEIYKGLISVAFLAGAGTDPRVEVIQKFYIQINR